MNFPIEIKTRNLFLAPPFKAEVLDRAAKLEQFFDRITRCRIALEGPGPHHRNGLHHVIVDLSVPGNHVIVNRQTGNDLSEVLHQALSAAGRRLEDHVRRIRHLTKEHKAPPRARVAHLFPERGYGFLEDAQGREIYFHRNSLVNIAFEKLKVGCAVRFCEELGDKGPQASSVTVTSHSKPRRVMK